MKICLSVFVTACLLLFSAVIADELNAQLHNKTGELIAVMNHYRFIWFLFMTSPIRYKITRFELLPDGIFKKEEVTIYKEQ